MQCFVWVVLWIPGWKRKHPWLIEEKKRIKEFVVEKKNPF